jgi:hypothetical protein
MKLLIAIFILLFLTADMPTLSPAQAERMIADYLEGTTLRELKTLDASMVVRCGWPEEQKRYRIEEAIEKGVSPLYIAQMIEE